MHLGSAIATGLGVIAMFVPGLQVVGLGLIGFGVGSFIGGNITEMNGYGFESGWFLGGAVGLAIGVGLGYLIPYLGTTAFNLSIPTIKMMGNTWALSFVNVAVSWGTVALGGVSVL